MSNAEDDDVLHFDNDFLSTSNNGGVVDKAGGHFLVEAQSSPDMSVKVNTGVAYVWATSLGIFCRVKGETDVENLNISNNASGSTRYDLICLKIDPSASPDANASNVASLVVVEGTPGGGVPATPANHLKLAEITVINAETEITSAEIKDSRTHALIQAGKTMSDGWVPANEVWTYYSPTQITAPSGAGSKYQPGDIIKLTQTTVKYFYTIAVADTLLTVNGGSDYSVANAPITNNYYSKAANPQGFPGFFNWTPAVTYGGGTTDPTSTTITYARYSISGAFLIFNLKAAVVRGSGDRTSTRFSQPANKVPPSAPSYDGRTSITGAYAWCFTYDAGASGILASHGAMTSDGNILVSGFVKWWS